MATATAPSCSQLNALIKVDVSLCGSIPRQEMNSLRISKQTSLPSVITDEDAFAATQLCCQLSNIQEQIPTQRRASPEFEAPSWAVPASGEARLEPVCDSVERQSPVDLTDRPVFRIGRSPQSDVQLLHATSSRKHAMLFHHSNGSCYVVDCGSAHGTYINGVRISSPPNGGVVVPHKVRRGSLIRFGGPGAPQFMLKSFAFALEDMRETASANTSVNTDSMGEVVQHNTRLNSLGKTAKDSLLLCLSSKRSFESMATVDGDEECKRCSSPPLSPEQLPVRLVSPEMEQPCKRRRVSFASDPLTAVCPTLVSPDLSSDENDI